MLDLPVPALVRSEALFGRVERVLRSDRLELRLLSSPCGLGRVLPECGTYLVDLEELRDNRVRRSVYRSTLGSAKLLPVLLLPGAERSLAAGLPPGAEVCVVVIDLHTLPSAVRRCRFRAWRNRLERRMRDARKLPFALRQALITVLRQEIPPLDEGRPMIWTVESIARQVGVSRGYQLVCLL